jgi:hypothetical protein
VVIVSVGYCVNGDSFCGPSDCTPERLLIATREIRERWNLRAHQKKNTHMKESRLVVAGLTCIVMAVLKTRGVLNRTLNDALGT